MSNPADITINGYELTLTCSAFPEQYDVRKDGEVVGYLRLRHGQFKAVCPWVGGDEVYRAEPEGNGQFEPHERTHFLTKAVGAIAARETQPRKEDQ